MGATVFHNYRDFQFRNTLTQPLLLRVSVPRPVLCGSVLSTSEKVFDVEIYETEHRFVRRADGSVWRENRVAKRVKYLDGRAPLEVEIAHNVGRVWYDVPEECIERESVSPTARSVELGARAGENPRLAEPEGMSGLGTPLLLLIFIASAAATWIAGVYLSKATDAIDIRLGIGEALGGMILLASAGSLPELAVTVSGALQGNFDLVAGNLLGGIAMQTTVLVICEGDGEKPDDADRKEDDHDDESLPRRTMRRCGRRMTAAE